MRSPLLTFALIVALAGCETAPDSRLPPQPTVTATASTTAPPAGPEPLEPHLTEVKQITFGG
ncbi:MAG: hypothetical protein JNK04_18015, partial [Myxococcales bacterium]|nr:hypothetical protein [Myxococcales bacterium]